MPATPGSERHRQALHDPINSGMTPVDGIINKCMDAVAESGPNPAS